MFNYLHWTRALNNRTTGHILEMLLWRMQIVGNGVSSLPRIHTY